jgi:H+/gluconate symporter-like permease
VTGALVLLVFAAFAVLMYLRMLPAILAVPLMAVTMSYAAGVPLDRIGTVVVAGASSLSSVYVAVIFGALLGRVTLDCGIARALVNLAAEYGGESPFALAVVLCAVVALLFTSLSGLGAIIMVGSIVLPIMMTTGVPRAIAATLFLMAFALGFIFNIVNWKFYTQFFGVEPQQLTHYAIVLAAIDAAALLLYAGVSFARERGYAAWAERHDDDESGPSVPGVALLTPVLPIVLYYALRMDPTLAFALSAIFGVLVTRPRRAVETLVAAAIRGIEDVAPAILLFIGIGMLLVATAQPQFAHALSPLVTGGWARNPIAYVVIFGLASPLVLYRGPLNPFGVGIAVFTVLLSSHTLPPVVLVAAVMAVVQVQNVCDPTNTANVWVANFTGVPLALITRRTLPYQVGVATIATLFVVLGAPAIFGGRAFARAATPAQAAALGFFAPAAAANRIGIGDDGSPIGIAATKTVVASLEAPLQGFAYRSDPDASDCSAKPYAAYIQILVSTFRLSEGTDLDIGLRLEDCGGWIVSEWHDHRLEPSAPTPQEASVLASAGAARLQEWAAAQPARAAALFKQGVDAAPGDPPSFYYSFFKTPDGNMRVYVRAGGPAYDDGLRTNDVLEKIDGLYWWDYGTFQTQRRAYDGEPHRLEVQRGGRSLDVQLTDPYSASRGTAWNQRLMARSSAIATSTVTPTSTN